jgi:hypothetical protein
MISRRAADHLGFLHITVGMFKTGLSIFLCKCRLSQSGNRPSNWMAKRLRARFQSRTGMVHFFAACSMAKYTTFSAERSLGKMRRLLMALRMTLFSDSMAFVV